MDPITTIYNHVKLYGTICNCIQLYAKLSNHLNHMLPYNKIDRIEPFATWYYYIYYFGIIFKYMQPIVTMLNYATIVHQMLPYASIKSHMHP